MVRTVPVALIASLVLFATPGARGSEYDHLVAKHAAANGVPESLVRRVIHIESKGNPRVVSKGNYGLMQIRLGTARAMGYGGDAAGLLDADTNMTYAVKYLAGAYRVARGNHAQAIRHYQRGYYYQAKAMGISPYNPVSATQQAAAPDPAMLRDAEERRKAEAAKRAAAEQSRIEEQTRVEAQRIALREAALRERTERQKAAEQSRAAQQQAALEQQQQQREEAQRRNQAAAVVAPAADAEQAKVQRAQEADRRQTERDARNRSRTATAQSAPSRTARGAAPETAWYSPMRFFNHPSHKAHPYRAAEGIGR